jgi:hypothetical protein
MGKQPFQKLLNHHHEDAAVGNARIEVPRCFERFGRRHGRQHLGGPPERSIDAAQQFHAEARRQFRARQDEQFVDTEDIQIV